MSDTKKFPRFRAWNLTHKYMTFDISMVQDEKTGEPRYYYGNPDDGVCIDSENWILMQSHYSPMDKLIFFEGDRVDVYFARRNKRYKGEIVLVDGCFDILFDDYGLFDIYQKNRDCLKCHTVNHAVQIIGNIYDNNIAELNER